MAPTRAEWLQFFKNLGNSVWGTVLAGWSERNAARFRAPSRTLEVDTVDLVNVIAAHGVPYFLKIDIEGMDLACLEALSSSPEVPDFVSIESEKRSFDRLREEFRLLEALGYDDFKVVQQGAVSRQKAPREAREGLSIDHAFIPGASGLFGKELPGRWLSKSEALAAYARIFVEYRMFGDFAPGIGRHIGRAIQTLTDRPTPGWYDTHARRIGVR